MELAKNISLLILAGAVSISAMAQSGTKSKEQQKEYHFTTVKANPVTGVKDQVADMSEKSWGDVATIPDFEANDIQITQEIRQIAYDNKETTDDHAMHVYGISKDQNGSK